MSQLNKLASYLQRSRRKNGVTASMIASGTGIPRDSVRKRIFDLREEGFSISSMRRNVNGESKVYYRLSA